jgi:hypothetical protein
MATSPDRRIIPRIGGFSFSRVPRPGAPLCPAPPRPILAANGFRTSLVAGLHVYFIALYYSTEFAAWLPCNDFPAKKGCHLMRYVWVEVELHGNLAIWLLERFRPMRYSITIHTPIGWCFFARMVSVKSLKRQPQLLHL